MTARDKLLVEIGILRAAYTIARAEWRDGAVATRQREILARSHLMRAQARLRTYDDTLSRGG